MENQTVPLPTAIKTVWRVNALIDAGSLAILSIIGFWLGWQFDVSFWTICGWFLIGAALLVLIAELALINYRWHFWTYQITDRDIELHKGYFFRKVIVIPIARVQNVNLEQGPLLRWQGLQAVKLVTAATSHKIDGVTTATASQLKDLIMRLAQEANNDL